MDSFGLSEITNKNVFTTFYLYFLLIEITNKSINEDFIYGIFHAGFAVFNCKEYEKHIERRLPVDDDENDFGLSELIKNNIHTECFSLSIKSHGAYIKRIFSKWFQISFLLNLRFNLRNLIKRLKLFYESKRIIFGSYIKCIINIK